MGADEKFCLRWNDFESNISLAFREIREEKDFFDCTLSCGSRQIQAHKLILSACSPFFRSILKHNPHQHPLLYLKGVRFTDLQAVLNFMYHGEVNVAQEELNSFFAVAEDVKIKGLTQSNSSEPKPKTDTPKHRPVNIQEGPRATSVTSAHPTQQQRNQHSQDDDEVQELQLAVKTEPEHHQVQQLSHSSVSSYTTQGKEQIQVDNQVASMEDNYVEEDAYDYAGYDADGQGAGYDGYDAYNSSGLEACGLAETNKEGLIQYSNGQYECGMCGRGFPLKITCRRHVQNFHSDSQKVLCHVCNKYMKNTGTLKAHLRRRHGIYQGGKST